MRCVASNDLLQLNDEPINIWQLVLFYLVLEEKKICNIFSILCYYILRKVKMQVYTHDFSSFLEYILLIIEREKEARDISC